MNSQDSSVKSFLNLETYNQTTTTKTWQVHCKSLQVPGGW